MNSVPRWRLAGKTIWALHKNWARRQSQEGRLDQLADRVARTGSLRDYSMWHRVARSATHPVAWRDEVSVEHQARLAVYRKFHSQLYKRQNGGLLMMRAVGPSPSGEVIQANAFYVDIDNGNDANDGILVADGGTGPLATLDALVNLIEAATSGHVLTAVGAAIWAYVRAGATDNTLDQSFVCAGGGASALSYKYHIAGYPGENPIIDCTTVGGSINMASNFSIEDLYFYTNHGFMSWGTNRACPGAQLLKCTLDDSRAGTTTTDNTGQMNIQDNNDTSDMLIEDVELSGNLASTGSFLDNTSSMYFYQLGKTTSGASAPMLRRVWAKKSNDFGSNFYNKRAPPAAAGDPAAVSIRVHDSVIHCILANRSNFQGVQCHWEFDNCIWLQEDVQSGNGLSHFRHSSGESSTAENYAGHHSNSWNHNTFFAPSGVNRANVRLAYRVAVAPSCEFNVVTNNVFANGSFQIDGSYESATGNSVSSEELTYTNNLSPSTGNTGSLNDTDYTTVSSFETAINAIGDTSNASGNVEEDANWATTPVLTTLANIRSTFVLNGASAGAGSASDALDMGAVDLANVGPIGNATT